MLTLLDSQSRSIWVGLSLHICLKLNTALLLYHASWFLGVLLSHPLCISESWLIVATSEVSDYTMAKTSVQIPTHYRHRPETTEIDSLNSAANTSFIH